MDSPAQIDGGSSKPFWLIRFKNVIYKQKSCRANYRLPKCSNIDFQTIFGDDFYIIPNWKTPPRPPEPLELPENYKNTSKSTQIFPKNVKSDPRLKKSTLCSRALLSGSACVMSRTERVLWWKPMHVSLRYRLGLAAYCKLLVHESRLFVPHQATPVRAKKTPVALVIP